jgi:spermidine synthase
MSPFIGSSLATWTSVIGMFLAGISLGNWAGGRLADRSADGRTLRLLLWTGGLALAWSVVAIRLLGDGSLIRAIPLYPRIAVLSFVVCFPAAFTLSMTTPVAIKLLLPDVRATGRIVGLVYALGTLGSLAGNFFTGFVLMAYFGVTALVLGAAVGMLLLGIIVPGRLHAGQAEAVAARPDHGAVAPQLGIVAACAVVFVCSFCSMALELNASRLLAPSLGVSIYTWTGIIGVVLAGVTVGNSLGGFIADRSPKRETLGSTLFWTGLLTLGILVVFASLNSLAGQPTAPEEPWYKVWRWAIYYANVGVNNLSEASLPWKVVLTSAVLFFLPMLAFGTISPQVTRLAVSDWEHAGATAGRIYAWSCAGAIAGTFAAGWFLIGALGSMALTIAIGVLLLLLALPAGNLWRKPTELLGAGIVLAGLALVLTFARDKLSFRPAAIYEKETNYYLISISKEDDEDTSRRLVLDLLIHSHVYGEWVERDGKREWVADVSKMGYGHEQVQAEFVKAAAAAHPKPNVLVIGGGGYTLPRYVDKFVPEAQIDVVEIDPGVTEAVHAALGMPRDTKIRTFNLDGRQYVQELARPGSYQVVIQDAVNDLSVPAHIMTREYNAAVRKILTDDGVYLLTVIDEFGEGRLLPAAIKTMQASFPHVALLGDRPLWDDTSRAVFVIAGSSRAFDFDQLRAVLKLKGIESMVTQAMPPDRLAKFLTDVDAKTPIPTLTDDFAPVDHLIAETFRRR